MTIESVNALTQEIALLFVCCYQNVYHELYILSRSETKTARGVGGEGGGLRTAMWRVKS